MYSGCAINDKYHMWQFKISIPYLPQVIAQILEILKYYSQYLAQITVNNHTMTLQICIL